MRENIAPSGWSHDQQVIEALDWLTIEHPDEAAAVRAKFPEPLIWEGAWLNTAAMGVEPDWSSWLADELEATGHIEWIDGEVWGTA